MVMKSSMKFDGNIQKPVEHDEGPVDFERAIFLAGKGKFNQLLLLAMLPVCWAITYASSTMSYVLPSAECDLKLTMLDKGMLNSVTFAGMILTSFLAGFIVDAWGRQKIMVYGLLIVAIGNFASCFSQVSWHLILFKFIDGSITSGPYAALQSYLAEVHGEQLRAQIYMWMGVLFALGNISVSCLAWLVMSRNRWELGWDDTVLEISSWRLFLAICTLPALAASIALCFFPESPRFLLAKNRHDDALNVFRRIYACNTGKDLDSYPVKSLEEEETPKMQGVTFKNAIVGSFKQIQPIFLPPNVVTLVITSFIQFGATIGSNTLKSWMPMLFDLIIKYQGSSDSFCEKMTIVQQDSSNSTNEDIDCSNITGPDAVVYTNSIIIAVASVIGYMIAKTLVNYVSKRILMVICFVGAGICCGVLYWANDSNSLLAISSIFVALTSIGGSIVNNVVVDMFPTSLRTLAFSITMVVGRVGALVGNLTFPLLLELDCLGPFAMIGFVCLMCATLVLVLPKKTKPTETNDSSSV